MGRPYSRRQFLLLSLSASAFAVPVFAEQTRRAKRAVGDNPDLALPWVKPGVGMAEGVKYHESYKLVKDQSLKTERQTVPFGPKQVCATCALYTGVGKKNGKDAGKCTLFSGQLVVGEGWCNSWSKKG